MTKEQAKEILWNRCQHTPETAEAIRVLFEEKSQGEWEKIGEIGLAYKCNRCGEVAVVPTNFCPNCGTKNERWH